MTGYVLKNIVTQKRTRHLDGRLSKYHYTADEAMKQLRDDFNDSPFITIQRVK